MVRILITIYFIVMLPIIIWSQKVGINTISPQEALDVNGKIKIGDDTTNSSPGTMRFNADTGDFEGYDGHDWVPFTPYSRETFWPAYGNRGAIGSYYDYSREDAVQGDKFGYSVDIDGDYAVVGSPEWNGGVGRAFVFKKEPVFGFWNVVDTSAMKF
ncbi:MAG: FG-GAP repeat protein [Saprospiraceae bacterium]|nr:FG-GAP repeat protein [Saprospiraceae bacterium]